MNRLVSAWRSTLGQKMVMAATGIIMIAFLFGHLAGNLLVFSGPAAINGYAHMLREHLGLLWIARAVLIASVLLHIVAAVTLWRRDRRARPIAYAKQRPQVATFASLTMRYSGLLLAAFIVFHLLHLTAGTIRPAPFAGADVYDNVVGGFRVPWVVALYVFSMILLGLHLYHGIWASLRTLGGAPASAAPRRRPIAAVVTFALWLGFTAIPIAIFAGWVK